MAEKHVLTLEQIRVLTSSWRLRIISALRARGEMSIAELGRELGQNPNNLYHHVKLLLKVGLVQESGQRRSGKNRETLYRAIPQNLVVDHAAEDEEYIRAHIKAVGALLADTARKYERGYRSSKRTRTLVDAVNVRLTPAQVDQLNARMREFLDELRESADPRGERHLVVLVGTPVGP